MVVTLQQKRFNQNYTDMKEELTLTGNALFDNERMNAVLTDGSNGCRRATDDALNGANAAARGVKAVG